MIIKKYVSYVSQTLCEKNRLESAVKNFIIKNNRKVIEASKLKHFEKKILDGVKALNVTYPRCTPVKAEFWSSRSGSGDRILSGAFVISFTLLACEDFDA